MSVGTQQPRCHSGLRYALGLRRTKARLPQVVQRLLGPTGLGAALLGLLCTELVRHALGSAHLRAAPSSQGPTYSQSLANASSAGPSTEQQDGHPLPRPPPPRRSVIEQGWGASIGDYPFTAMIVRPEDGRYLCAGTLVHPRIVLTAAHCVSVALDGRPNPGVQLGREGMSQTYGYEQFRTRSFVHPRFRPGSFDFDLAALVLEGPTNTQPVRMVLVGEPLGIPRDKTDSLSPYHAWNQLRQAQAPASPDADAFTAQQLVVLGWGATAAGGLPTRLQQSRVSPVALDQCQAEFQQFGSRITRRMVCVTGRTCAGDSGGPLLLSDSYGVVLVGQVSFGFPRLNSDQGCPRPNPVTAFTDLSAPRLRAWLQQAVLNRLDQISMDSDDSDTSYLLDATYPYSEASGR